MVMRFFFILLYFFQFSVFGQSLTKLEINEIEKAEIKGSLLMFREFLKMSKNETYWSQVKFKNMSFQQFTEILGSDFKAKF